MHGSGALRSISIVTFPQIVCNPNRPAASLSPRSETPCRVAKHKSDNSSIVYS